MFKVTRRNAGLLRIASDIKTKGGALHKCFATRKYHNYRDDVSRL